MRQKASFATYLVKGEIKSKKLTTACQTDKGDFQDPFTWGKKIKIFVQSLHFDAFAKTISMNVGVVLKVRYY